MVRQKLTLSVDSDVVDEAKKKRLPLSHIAEDALRKRLNLKDEELEKEYPFDFCEEHMPSHVKKTLFALASVKSRRCSECGKIYFVNDSKGEFKVCKYCWQDWLKKQDSGA